MGQKVKQAIEDLNKHLNEMHDTQGLVLLNQVLTALMEGRNDILRK